LGCWGWRVGRFFSGPKKISKGQFRLSEEIGVERKTEFCYLPDQPVRLTLLGTSQHTINAQMVKLAGRCANVKIDRAVAHGTAVRIDLNDSLLLGEVSTCVSESDGFVAMIGIVEAIPSLSDLAKLVAAVMNEARAVAPQRKPAEVISH
jgi:hypothetical protein